jgi:hypothetical protein
MIARAKSSLTISNPSFASKEVSEYDNMSNYWQPATCSGLQVGMHRSSTCYPLSLESNQANIS